MCFDDDDDRHTYKTRVEIRNGRRQHHRHQIAALPNSGTSWRRRFGLGGSYYPDRYYARPPMGRLVPAMDWPRRSSLYENGGYPGGVVAGGYSRALTAFTHPHPRHVTTMVGHRAGYGGYASGYEAAGRVAMSSLSPYSATTLVAAMEAYPKPRHQFVYTPRYGQRGVLSYAGQQPNGAMPAGVMPGGYGVGLGVGVGYAAGAYQPAVYNARSYYPCAYGTNYHPAYYQYPTYSGYYHPGLYGSSYPLANFCYPYQRTYYNTAPTYGYTAHVYPPGPTTTTTTYHVTNAQAQPYHAAPQVVRDTRPAFGHGHGHPQQAPSREEIQMENRRIATARGAYDPRKIRPADARDDDPFWCRELNGEWHLRSYYQIENECHPGRWMMDADVGFLVFHRGT